jgi:uncharacterized protein (TIGR01777 family)
MKIAVTGATGFIGRPLVASLQAAGHEVIAFSRREVEIPGTRVMVADLETSPLDLDGIDAIAHLAGESIGGKRWNAQQKQILRDSRIETTARLVAAIGDLPPDRRPHTLVSSSGIDYYAFADDFEPDEEVTEDAPAGETFLGKLCRDWEAEALAAERFDVRVVRLRNGLVLGDGGALAKMTTVFKFFVGGKLGNGKQWMSWIHLDDAVAIYHAALVEPTWRGAFNVVAGSVRNRDFAHALGTSLHRPSALPTPAFALRAAVGELAEYLLHGRRAIPAALTRIGYRFHHPDLAGALADRHRGA